MSVKHALSRGLELGRSILQLGVLKPAVRVAARFRVERLRVNHQTVQPPRALLPARYRYYRTSLSGLAAQLQSGAFARLFRGGSQRNRAVFLAFGVGLGLIDQQLEDDRRSAATCREIQAVFRKNKQFQNLPKPFTSGYKLEDYVIGKQIGKGCNGVVYEAAVPFAPPKESPRCSLVELQADGNHSKAEASVVSSHTSSFPLALKMMWNIGGGSSSEAILTSMSQELVPASPRALKKEQGETVLNGRFGRLPKKVTAHPNLIRLYRAFTAEVPLLPGAEEDYPAALPARLNPAGFGNNHTLFLVMKNYPCTLREYLQVCVPGRRQATVMLLQLLEGVDHLCRHGIAHRDLKTDNVLLEFDSVGCPRLVITDFGCCLADESLGLKLPFNSCWVNRGGNACLMAPEVATAVPGPGVEIDYSKADAWALGAIAYEIFGRPNPFYGPECLESRNYQESDLPGLPLSSPKHTQLVVRLLLRRNPKKRPSARVAANILHLSLWGRHATAHLNPAGVGRMAEWLLCQSAVLLLKGRDSTGGGSVEAELQREFLANLDLEELRIAIRAESAMLRAYNSGIRAAPYESINVADIADVNVNLYDLKDTCKKIRGAFRNIVKTSCIPLTLGGDHTIAYPILQAVAERHRPVGLIHVDAHADTNDLVLGEKIGHGTPFRRCVEEGLLDCKRAVQIGLRGMGYSPDAYAWSRKQDFRVVQVEQCWHKSLVPLMAEVRAQIGAGPVYLSFDINALDPAYAPGTGTPEIAGLTPIQGLEIIRGCRGLNIVGCDLVEVSPPYDTTGNTALTAANLLFEMLCVLPGVKYY